MDDFVYRSLLLAVRAMSLIPFRSGQRLGRAAGRLFSLLPVERNSVALEGLKASFDPMSDRDLRQLYRNVIVHFSQMVFEVPHVLRLTRSNLDKYLVFENERRLYRALEKGKGVLALTAHFGNWELMSAAISLKLKGHSAVVARPIDYGPAEQLIRRLRTHFGTEIIPKNNGLRLMIRMLRENRAIGVLLDQNVDWYDGVFVPFFGRAACANKGLALLALRTGAPVLPVFSVRQPDGRYRIVFGEEVPVTRSGDRTRDVEDNTARFTGAIEDRIRSNPDQWFWFHRRWKTRPFCTVPEGYWDFRVDGE